MKNLLNIFFLSTLVIVLAACDKSEDKDVELIDQISPREMIAKSLSNPDPTDGYRYLIEKLCETGVEWYEDVWFYSTSEYPETETLGDPIFSLHSHPIIDVPIGVKRQGFQFFEDGKLSVWFLDKEDKKGESISGEWYFDAISGTLLMSYMDLEGEPCTKNGILESIWWYRDMVVTIFDPDGTVNYYIWRRKWNGTKKTE